MLCLSVRQSWADCICPTKEMMAMNFNPASIYNDKGRFRGDHIIHSSYIGASLPKDVENRSWSTKHRGQLLIHAAKTIDFNSPAFITSKEPFVTIHEQGAIIGMVNVVDCTKEVCSRWHNRGYYGFYLANPIRFEVSVPCRGMPGLFDVKYDPVNVDGFWYLRSRLCNQ